MQAIGLKTHGWNTAIRSMLLLAGFPVLLTAMGYALALFLVAWDAPTVAKGLAAAARLLPTVVACAVVVAAIWFAIAWFAHLRIIDFFTGARPVAAEADEPRLWRLTEALCISRGMRLLRLAVIETEARNAFAAGLTPAQSAVTVTRGLMTALDDRELSAVLAHELSQIRNGDARLGVIAAVFVGVITLITNNAGDALRMMRWTGGRRSSSSSSSSRNSGNGGVVIVLILIAVAIAVLTHLLTIALRMALSRNREYLADAGAVEMTQDADAMITALRKVAQRPAMDGVPAQLRALFLHDAAMSAGVGWFATHPPIEERVGALVRFAGGHYSGPLPEFAEPPPAPEPEPADDDATVVPWKATDIVQPLPPAGTASPWGAAAPASPWILAQAATAPAVGATAPAVGATVTATPPAAEPRTATQERLDAMAAFLSTQDKSFMENQAKREEARSAGRNPDDAAPPPPRRG